MRLGRRPDVQQHPGALAWLFTTVRNACLRMLRPFARQRQLTLVDGDEDEVVYRALTPDEALARQELVRAVHTVLIALPDRAREVVVLRDLVREGLVADGRFIRRHHR